MTRRKPRSQPVSETITHEEAVLIGGLLAGFKIIRLLLPHYIGDNPKAAEMTVQLYATMAEIEAALAPYRPKPRRSEFRR